MISVLVVAPLTGTAVPLTEVPDPVFAQTLVGPGIAIVPGLGTGREGVHTVLAPISGRLLKLKPHAFVVAHGRTAVLVHLGIDTVLLDGAASSLIAAPKQLVNAGEPVMVWDAARVTAQGLNPICPVVALDAAPTDLATLAYGAVEAGADLFRWMERVHG